MSEFGQWLFSNRKGAELTQEELALRAGCSKSYISTLERSSAHSMSGGDITPSVELVDKFADALNVGRASARLAAGYAPPQQQPDIPIRQDLERLSLQLPSTKRPIYWRLVKQNAESVKAALLEESGV